MNKGLKKAGFIACVIASIMVICSTAAGWFNTSEEKKDDTTETAQVVSVINE